MCLSTELYREAKELLLISSSLRIVIVFALMDQNSLDQQHRLGATKFLPGLPRAGWMKAFTWTLPCMDTPGPTVAVEWYRWCSASGSDSAAVSIPKAGIHHPHPQSCLLASGAVP